jgi:hypothetical protein
MNARFSHSLRFIRIVIIIVFASLVHGAGQSPALAQADAQLMAVQYFDGILGNASLGASALISPEARLHTPEGIFRGTEGARDFGAGLQESFSDLSFTASSSETVGDYIVVEFMMTGIHTGTYRGAEPGCAGIVVPGMAVLQADGSGITEQWVSYDSQTVLDQIYVFGLFETEGRPSCGDSQPAVPSVAPSIPPACMTGENCETPF